MSNDPRRPNNIPPPTTPSKAQISLLHAQEQLHEEMSDSGLLQYPRPAGKADLLKERGLSILLKSLSRLHADIVTSTSAAVVPTRSRVQKTHPAYRLTKLGANIRGCCNLFLNQGNDQPDWVNDYADHLFSPVITVMLRAMKRWAADISFGLVEGNFTPIDERDAAALRGIQLLVTFVRRVSGTRKFKFAWHDYTRQANENFRSARKYVQHLFTSRTTRLLVLRVDLYLRPGNQAWGFTQEADRHAARLQRLLRDGGIVPGFLGSISKRENGIHRGMHWHCMFFLNGHRHDSANFYSQAIGEAWVKLVGGDRASYFNCYSRRHEYKFNGLGIVNIDDIGKLIGIRAALHYMTKRDCVLKATSGKQQDFRRSKQRAAGPSGGAPRKVADSLCEVKRALSGTRSPYPAWLSA
ncbi:hypothetical protein O4D10_02090 [Xanthomonas citri pv. citri]|uniref:hypothetical protein n=1 Tax=Xanthomonas citri TaxID=346 RepID=UPI0036D7FF27